METVTKKTISVEFEGQKYALAEDAVLSDLLEALGFDRDMPARLVPVQGGFALVVQ